MRFIFKLRGRAHITPFYVELDWLKIDNLGNYFMGCFTYNLLSTDTSLYIARHFERRVVHSQRLVAMMNGDLIVPFCNHARYEHSFNVKATKF